MGVPEAVEAKASSRTRPNAASPQDVVYLDDDDEDYAPMRSKVSRKRKPGKDASDDEKPSKKGRKASKKENGKDKDDGEKRLARFRPRPTEAYKVLLERASTQRMFVINRTPSTDANGTPTEKIDIAGSTGNLYTVTIGHKPTCNCPHAEKGNECKHVVYVLTRTLKAPENLCYQRAFLSSELQTIFANAPPIPTAKGADDKNDDGLRKSWEGEECPICCVEFSNTEKILYCKAACGNNVHEHCFQQWAAQKRATGGGVTCPFCRSTWQEDEKKVGDVDLGNGVQKDGYVNLAGQLGLSGLRDTSSYHQVWVRQQRRRGGLGDEDLETAMDSWWYR
ncbi:MAG: hypothetical protein Q9159_002266 [Coniocarpon cinnabarinum]